MDEQKQDGLLDEFDLDAWGALEPSDNFADRVMDAWAQDSNTETPQAAVTELDSTSPPVVLHPAKRWGIPVLSAALGAAAASLMFLVWPKPAPLQPEPVQPSLVNGILPNPNQINVPLANDTQSANLVAMGELGSAICDDGAQIAWNVDDRGTIHIQQDKGEVLYHLSNAANTVVNTPGGNVEVNGNLFRVVIDDAKLAIPTEVAATRVTVLEGSGYLSNDNGGANLGACETAQVSADGTPTMLESEGEKIPLPEPTYFENTLE